MSSTSYQRYLRFPGAGQTVKLASPPVITLEGELLTVTLPFSPHIVNPTANNNVGSSDVETNTIGPVSNRVLYLSDESLRQVRKDVVRAVSGHIGAILSKANPLANPKIYWPLRASIERSAMSRARRWQLTSCHDTSICGQGVMRLPIATSGGSLTVQVVQTDDPMPSTTSHKCEPAYHELHSGVLMPSLRLISRADLSGYDLHLTMSSLLLTTLSGSREAYLSQMESFLVAQVAVSALITIHRLYNESEAVLVVIGITQTFEEWLTGNLEFVEKSVQQLAVEGLLKQSTADEVRILPNDYSTVPADVLSTSFGIHCPSIIQGGPRLTLMAHPGPCEAV